MGPRRRESVAQVHHSFRSASVGAARICLRVAAVATVSSDRGLPKFAAPRLLTWLLFPTSTPATPPHKREGSPPNLPLALKPSRRNTLYRRAGTGTWFRGDP